MSNELVSPRLNRIIDGFFQFLFSMLFIYSSLLYLPFIFFNVVGKNKQFPVIIYVIIHREELQQRVHRSYVIHG